MEYTATNYVINPYVIHQLPDNRLVLQNRAGIVILTDEKIKKIVNSLEQKIGEQFNDSKLIKVIGDDYNDYLNFLIENKIINEITLPSFNVRNIHFYSNSSVVGKLVTQSFQSHSDFWKVYSDENTFSKMITNNKNDFFLVFLNPYNKLLGRKLRDHFINTNTLSIMSYVYKGHFYFESVYSPLWKTPCHICQFSHIESELRFGAAYHVTYQQIIDYIYKKDSTLSVETPLKFSDSLNIATQITNRVNQLLALDDESLIDINEFTKGLVLDLTHKEVKSDTTHHWELCDCYE